MFNSQGDLSEAQDCIRRRLETTNEPVDIFFPDQLPHVGIWSPFDMLLPTHNDVRECLG